MAETPTPGAGEADIVALRPLSRGQRLLYRVIRAIVVALARLWFRVEVDGARNLPPSGAYIVAPAHRSNLDAVLVQAVTRRQLRLMGKDSLWRAGGPWGWLLTSLGGFPVARGTADRVALRTAQGLLEQGEAVVLFPEGTRQSGAHIHELFDGPAFLASRTGVPIIPVGIGGSEAAMGKGAKIPKPKKITFVIGAPMLPPERSESGRVPRRQVRELTDRLHAEVQAVFDEAQRRAGQPVPASRDA
jgi:1-acyl-sn-glycerol-3-phosphate acyltransferase